jgi:hypothetical protein
LEALVIAIVAFIVSGLTFFSGFGLGSLLLPAFALFFPVEIAVSATAVVHFLNNIFKFTLIGKHADLKIVLKFGIPAALTALLGAWLLNFFSQLHSITNYELFGHELEITPAKLMIAMLMLVFAYFEINPNLKNLSVRSNFIPLGGALSGFFGGLSGHQGALRTAFLLRTGLEKKQFIATAISCAIIVDVFRIFIYGITFIKTDLTVLENSGLLFILIVGTLSAFAGAVLGRLLLNKITMKGVRVTVAIMLFTLGIALGMGII